MAILVKPHSYAKERWAQFKQQGSGVLFFFSGYARFNWHDSPEPQSYIHGEGDNDSKEQEDWVEYLVTDMIIGPHWRGVKQVCPIVVVGGHSQFSPDEADAMGFEVINIEQINMVQIGSTRRIELQVKVRVRGGRFGDVLSLAYQVTAYGVLDNPKGDEGLFFGQL